MANNLDSFYTHKFENQTIIQSSKILCILEGGDELSFIKRVYEVFNQIIACQEFVNKKIKLSYGKSIIEWQGNTLELREVSKKKCNFQGGDTQEGKVPLPILASLNNEDLEIYKAIIVMFDKDRDSNNEVELQANEILNTYPIQILFLSNPCFEKETITFFDNENIQKHIKDKYEIINDSKCQWYKSNYGELLKLNPIKNKKKLATIIPILEKSYFEEESINENMKKLITFLQLHLV